MESLVWGITKQRETLQCLYDTIWWGSVSAFALVPFLVIYRKDAGRAYGCDVGCSPDIVWRAYRKPYGEILDEGGGKASEWSVRAVHKF